MKPILQTIRHFFSAFLPEPNFREIAPGLGTAADYLQRYENPDRAARFEGLKTYRDLRQKESFIKSALQIHRDISYLWVTAAGMSPDDDHAKHAPQLLPASDAPEDVMIWEFVAQNLDFQIKRGMKQVLKQTQQSALTYGYAVEEVLWSRDRQGRVIIADILDRDPEMFLYLWTEQQWYLKNHPCDSQGTPIPPRKFLCYAPHFYQENVYGVSELADLVHIQYAIEQIELFCQRHLEKHGSGLMFGKYPKARESDKAWQENLLALLIRLRNQGVSVLPEDVKLEILESSGASELFITYLNYLLDKISVSLTGNNMTMKAPSVGSQALSDNTAAVSKSQTEQNDATSICHAYDNVIQWLVDYNFPNQVKYPYLQLIDPRKMNPVAPANTEQQAQSNEAIEVKPGTDTPEQPAAEKPTTPSLRTFAEEQGNAPAEDPSAQKRPGLTPRPNIPKSHFPVEPDIYKDKQVIERAKDYMKQQRIMTRREFDKLSDEEKADAFTITAALKDDSLIRDLHTLLIDTLDEVNEAKAWQAYQKAAVDLLDQSRVDSIVLKDLFTSFRFARQRALNQGIMATVNASPDDYYGFQYASQDDSKVRVNHEKMHGVIRPIDDPIWQLWTPPAGFNCRCSLLPITKDMQRAEPEKWQYTTTPPTVKPDRDFRRSKEEETTQEEEAGNTQTS